MKSIHITTAPGNPSTFWTNDNVTFYRTKKDCEAADTSKAVNPQDYIQEKSFWNQNKKTILVALAVLTIIGLLFYLYHKGTITFHVHKSSL